MAREKRKARHMVNLPSGDKPITNVAIARTRFEDTFETHGPLGNFKGRFYDLVQKVGVYLNLPPGDAPEVILRQPIVGVYLTGTKFTVKRASLFTNTSKMPGPSFAIPAGPPVFGGTCPAAALGENVSQARQVLEQRTSVGMRRSAGLTVLNDAGGVQPQPVTGGLTAGVQRTYAGDDAFVCRSCYALNGNYVYPSKQVNDMMHLAWIEYELANGGPERLGAALAYAIQHVNLTRQEGFQPYFRIHDAGDFHREDYLEAWVVCASMMTHMRFWAPTRQWVFPKWVRLLQSAVARVEAAGGWLSIRPSVLRIGDRIPEISGLSAGSGVDAEKLDPCVWVCPVYNKLVPRVQPDGTVRMEEASSCLEANCTMCWDQPAIPVTYGAH